MDLLPASSLLSPLSRVFIRIETQFHLTEPIFLPVLIYGPDHDLEEGGRLGAKEASGKGRSALVRAAGGTYALPADWDKQKCSHHGKSPVGSQLELPHCGLRSTTIGATRKERGGAVLVEFIECPKYLEAQTKAKEERMWVS